MIQSTHVIALTNDSADKTLTIKKGQIFTPNRRRLPV
jgi:hypothetical protein